MKKLSAATFAMALSLGGLSLAGCTKDDSKKDKPAEKAAPDEQGKADQPKGDDKPSQPEAKQDEKAEEKPADETKDTGETAENDKAGASTVTPAADKEAEKKPTEPTHTVKKPKPKGCGGGCGKKAPEAIKISKDEVKNPVEKKEPKKPKEGGCGSGSCG